MGVTPHQGARESRAQGEVAQVVRCPGPVRYARCGTPKLDWSLVERCSKATTGELLEIERLTSSLERGHWKSTRKGNSLVAYSTASWVNLFLPHVQYLGSHREWKGHRDKHAT